MLTTLPVYRERLSFDYVQAALNWKFYSIFCLSLFSDLYPVPGCGSRVWCCGSRSWRSRAQGSFWPVWGWLQHCLRHQALPHQVPHCGCTGITTHVCRKKKPNAALLCKPKLHVNIINSRLSLFNLTELLNLNLVHRVGSMQLWATWSRMTGGGIFMTQ